MGYTRTRPFEMKYPRFESFGSDYPHALEQRYERILTKIDALWDEAGIDDYFNDLLIDKRGGRQGFPHDVLADIMRLAHYHQMFHIKEAERRAEAIAYLTKRGMDASSTTLLAAVESGDQILLDWLLRAGVNLHVKDNNGSPPLVIALIKGYTIIAQMLIKAGADVNEADQRKLTPLLLACGKSVPGYRAVAEALIRKGAFINIRDALGNTPLLLSLSGGTEDIAILLIESGADIRAATRNGNTALALANKLGNVEIARLLQAKEEEPGKP